MCGEQMEKNPGKYMEKSTNNLGEIWQLIVGSQTSKICKRKRRIFYGNPQLTLVITTWRCPTRLWGTANLPSLGKHAYSFNGI
jgi:hypothetical protein